MSININIIDQRIKKIADQYQAEIQQQLNTTKTDKSFLMSSAFVLLCIQTILDISLEEALEYLTEGGNDAGIDGLHVGDLQGGEFLVTLFQGKYKQKLDGSSHFPENAIIKLLNTLSALFDPDKSLTVNSQLQPLIEEIRGLIRDGYLPTVRVMLCNNGLPWRETAQQRIDNADLGKQVNWLHINHDKIIEILQRPKSITENLQLIGKAVIEEFNFRRVLIGRVPVSEIKRLFEQHGERLLERNIRRYLGLQNNRINRDIQDSLLNSEKCPNFYFYNNGITMICNQFRHNALQQENYSVKIENLQIINGGQTCMTITNTLTQWLEFEHFKEAYVLLRLYELDEQDENLVHDITYATNSQNPVDLRDLRANDPIQQKLELAVKDLGYEYKRKRDIVDTNSSNRISSQIAARTILAIWRRKPHQAKFREKETFGQFYEEIFTEQLNGAQLILAVLIFQMVENERKNRIGDEKVPIFLPYATYFIAMLVGEQLLKKQAIPLEKLEHQHFAKAKSIFEESHKELYQLAIQQLETVLKKMYRDYQTMSLQRLAATFRRGDLLEFL